jgi:hypothetical protein
MPALTGHLMARSGYLPDLVVFFAFGGAAVAEGAPNQAAGSGSVSQFADTSGHLGGTKLARCH